MMVLLVSVLMLFGAPALLLWMGKFIARVTDPARRRLAVQTSLSGSEWFFRPSAPLLGRARDSAAPAAEAAWPASGEKRRLVPWFRRPLRPLFGAASSPSALHN